MSQSYRVLQGGNRRRTARGAPGRPRRTGRGRRTLAFSLVGLLVLAGVLLVVMPTRASGPSRIILRSARSRPSPSHALRSLYGTRMAPSSERINLRLRLGLRSGMLFDVRSGAILWAHDPTRVLPIASLTKMMTALVVAARSRPTDRVLITPEAVRFTGSGVGLLPVHKRVSELGLLYGLLQPRLQDRGGHI